VGGSLFVINHKIDMYQDYDWYSL